MPWPVSLSCRGPCSLICKIDAMLLSAPGFACSSALVEALSMVQPVVGSPCRARGTKVAVVLWYPLDVCLSGRGAGRLSRACAPWMDRALRLQ
jgi:hypothetical protein